MKHGMLMDDRHPLIARAHHVSKKSGKKVTNKAPEIFCLGALGNDEQQIKIYRDHST
jgi:hypothetical protein